ncbi:glutamate--cysteine ligase [uncultured Jatrophihabitans sp.]|uniref:carboxylate-amine ligase n=1 Tax=uncultured Jatrophihabitans sp. TaxID=1610747 RepID=UPI0035C9F020
MAQPRTLGVEEEFLLIGARDGELRPVGDPVAHAADTRSDGQFEHELKREQAELGTTPHTDLGELHAELRRRRVELARSADEHGVRLLAVGVAPTDDGATTTREDRYETMSDIFGETARGALSCGMHVHVSVESRAEGVALLNGVRPWLPLVLALSANSPFRGGRDTSYESYRAMLWQRWPTAGATGPFADVADYERIVAALIESGAALDEGMLYFDARLSAKYPTLEFRVADVCVHTGDAVALAGLCRAVVEGCARGVLPPVPPDAGRAERLRAANWRAARHGVTDQLVDPRTGGLVDAWALVDGLFDALQPVLGDAAEVFDGVATIRTRGTGSRLQRDTFARTGDLDAVVDTLAAATLA